MKEETQKQIEASVNGWAYLKTLPRERHGFLLREDRQAHGDIYDIFTYENKTTRRRVTVYYHDETREYKLRVAVGLTEFCKEDFIAPDIEALEQILNARFEKTLRDLAVFSRKNIDSLVIDKKILEWRYLEKWPKTLEGFTLYIQPDAPFRSINGSYIIFAYCDFAAESDFIIYYNIFRDEFFGEARIRNIPDMNYLFDSHELSELEEKLDLHLLERLREIREKIDKDTKREELK